MKITNECLKSANACKDGREWFKAQTEMDGVKVVEKLVAENKLEWAKWAICRLFDRQQKIQFAVFAAEQVLDVFEKKYPDDKRPRMAIAAAKAVVENDTKENRAAEHAASAAASAAWAASDAARAAESGGESGGESVAAYVASAAASAASVASDASDAASAAWAAAGVAESVASDAARAAMKKTILDYGLTLIREGK